MEPSGAAPETAAQQLTTALHNIQARHLHDIAASLPDDRQFLRSWRRQLQDCLTQQHTRMLRFLLADASGSATVSESDLTKRCTDIVSKYSKPTWSFTSSTRDLSLPTDTTATYAELEATLGMAPAALHEIMRKVVRAYVACATELCAAESRLEEKLRHLESVMTRINDLMFMEPTPELSALEQPMHAYLTSVLEKLTIEPEYRAVVAATKQFQILKGLVSLGSVQRPAGAAGAPACSICMTREISHAMTPCGHTFCDECSRSQMTACYICRVQVRDRLRLYFS